MKNSTTGTARPTGFSLPRFATWQAAKGAWRVIDNGKPVHNRITQLDERIHTTAHSVSFAIAQFVEGLIMDGQLERRPCNRSTRDLWKAYRQIPRRDDHGRFQIICIWHPVRNE